MKAENLQVSLGLPTSGDLQAGEQVLSDLFVSSDLGQAIIDHRSGLGGAERDLGDVSSGGTY